MKIIYFKREQEVVRSAPNPVKRATLLAKKKGKVDSPEGKSVGVASNPRKKLLKKKIPRKDFGR